MRPQTSKKYRKFRRSKYEFPTRHIMHSQAKGELKVGDKEAKRAIEKQLGRSLREGTKTMHTSTQWVWAEPKNV